MPDRANGIVPEVLFQARDVRDALRELGRRALIGITVSPDVQGVVTLSLRDVNWETALQNVTRQVDATYRFEHGWLYVVPRESNADPISSPSDLDLPGPYVDLARAVALGNGGDVRRVLASAFEVRNATETRRDGAVYQAVVDSFRSYPRYSVERTCPLKGGDGLETLIAYRRPGANPLYFHDSWREANGSLRLVSREETVQSPTRRFKDVLLSEVLRTIGEDVGVTMRIAPALDRRVTVDLISGTFETELQWLVRDTDLTYRIEGGVYEIVRRE